MFEDFEYLVGGFLDSSMMMKTIFNSLQYIIFYLYLGGSRFSLGGGGGGGGVGTPRFRNLHGSRLSLGLGARDLELARELDMVRELDVLRDLNVFRDLNGARDLTASRFSLTASDLNSR